ncbi:DUF4232 domain-containing protein, partial [Actinoplanes sp. URMC 104]|uniref:DUF4232 domain-containing protein n=1 Tax=Actinoplanes sp. URMC 104 TaxID=3423409 RepID=UPI003F1B0D52
PAHFRNNGADCWFAGYPTVVGLTAAGARVPVAQTPRGFAGGQAKGTDEVSPFLLERGDTVSAVIEALNATGNGRACPAVTKLRITPPKRTTAVTVAWTGGCAELQVHPVFRGTTGQDT